MDFSLLGRSFEQSLVTHIATDSTSASRDPARPSSSTSELFGGLYARGEVAQEVSDASWLQAMLDVEAALGAEQLDAREIDVAALGAEAADHASPVVPLAKRFPDAGATSQDILDTAMMLVAKRALEPLLDVRKGAAPAVRDRRCALCRSRIAISSRVVPALAG